MNKFLIIGLAVISNLLLNAESSLPKDNSFYYYIQKDHPVSLDTQDNETYYYIQKLHPSPLNTYNNQTYYFSQMDKEDQKKVVLLDISKEEKELELKKELLKDNIDWDKISNLNKEIEYIKVEINLMILKEIYKSNKQ